MSAVQNRFSFHILDVGVVAKRVLQTYLPV
jgi:hypothetical protein